MEYQKKLIEVALPLEAINIASSREKSIRHGHPSTLHLWWARRPLAACRAVLFASIVDDPSSCPEKFPTEDSQDKERQRLFSMIESLVKWESTNNVDVLNEARAEILKATQGQLPVVRDAFAGGGSIPLEAQRLGLEAHASDLNPVAVLINKAMIEIPPKFAGQPRVNPDARKRFGGQWKAAQGLAEDIRYYGQLMLDEAKSLIGHLYPKVKLPADQGGGEAAVIAWLWTRTVMCPNPACGIQMPLVRSFAISTKAGRRALVEPEVDRAQYPPKVRFHVRTSNGKPQEGTVGRQGATCIACGTPVPLEYVRAEGRAQRMSRQLMAIVAQAKNRRVYLSPNDDHIAVAEQAQPAWAPTAELPHNPRDFKTPNYGMHTFADLFTKRQLVALTTFSDLVSKVLDRIRIDAITSGLPNSDTPLTAEGVGALAYAEAVASYLAFAVDRGANYWSSLTPWGGDFIVQTFGRQALPTPSLAYGMGLCRGKPLL